mmetsp:Transcript_33005/g.50549  ORF Transcript_33005/g.50549 Transcript_33005/m.50549 type:complete len:83 (+) Transcript_33005:805-1053(+)
MEQIARQRKQLEFTAAEDNYEQLAKVNADLKEVENAATFEKLKNLTLRKEQEQLRSSSRSLYSIDFTMPEMGDRPSDEIGTI